MSPSKHVFPVFFVLTMLPGYLAGQTILWDQQPVEDFYGPGVANHEFVDATEFSIYLVNDATFQTNVVVDSVTFYFTHLTFWHFEVDEAVLNIFDGDTLLPVDDPTGGGDFGEASVKVTANPDASGSYLQITASDLNIQLDAGSYWFGLTPSLSASYGQEFALDTVGGKLGRESMYRNPEGGFGFGTDWAPASELWETYGDAAFTVRGESVPEPAATAVLLLTLGCGVAKRRGR